MAGTYRNLATEERFEENRGSLFLYRDDPDSKIEAYIAVDSTIVSDWQEIPPAEDPSTINRLQLESSAKGAPVKSATEASADIGHAFKVTLRGLDALREYTKTSRRLYVFFIRKWNSYSALSISSEFFGHCCEEISIPQTFRDYILYFGRRLYEVEITPRPFSFEAPGTIKFSEWEATEVIRFVGENSRGSSLDPSER